MPEKENEAGRAAVGEFGRLRIMVTSSIGMIPVQNARITISYKGVPDVTVVQLDTDNSGQTETIDLPRLEQPYSEYNVRVEAEGYEPVEVSGTEILPEVTAWQNVEMNPSETSEEDSEIIVIPEHTLYGEYPPKIEEDEIKPIEEGEIVLSRVVIPEYVIVHAGVPTDSTAKNYWVQKLLCALPGLYQECSVLRNLCDLAGEYDLCQCSCDYVLYLKPRVYGVVPQ